MVAIPNPKNYLTRFTDDRGRVKDSNNELFERHWIEKYMQAGVPEFALNPAGCKIPVTSRDWNPEDFPHGCVSDGILSLGNILQGIDDAGFAKRRNIPALLRLCDALNRATDALGCGAEARRVTAHLCSEVFMYRIQQYRVNGWKIPKDVQADLERNAGEVRAEMESEIYNPDGSVKW